jgi:tetratricopeptide (TPR) repeat protein
MEARAHLEGALTLARELGETVSISVALNGLAEFHRTEGDMPASLPLYEEGLALNRTLGNRSNVANALVNLAAASAALGDLDAPVAMLREALTLCDAIGSKSQGQFALDVSAGLAMARGAWARGVRLLGASDEQLKRMGLQREPPDERFIAPLHERARQALGDAAHDSAYEAGAALSYESATGEAAVWLSEQV